MSSMLGKQTKKQEKRVLLHTKYPIGEQNG